MAKSSSVQMKQLFAGNTANMYKHVLLGKADAGATLDAELGQQPPDVASQLRTIYQSKKIAPHPLAAHPRVPQKVRDALTTAILALGKDSKTAGLLKSVRLVEPVRADYARDYQGLEIIDIRKLTNAKE
jgi:phosphonate transport system substrate-binding protein